MDIYVRLNQTRNCTTTPKLSIICVRSQDKARPHIHHSIVASFDENLLGCTAKPLPDFDQALDH